MRLDDIAVRGSGHTPSKKHSEYWGGSISWVSLKDTFRLDKGYISRTTDTITSNGLAHSSAVIHPSGSVILLRDAGIGKSAVLASDMAVSQHFMAWACGPSLDNWYLYYVLQHQKVEFERIANGSTIKTIGLDYFKQLAVPLPDIQEQQRISQALRDVDSLIAALEQKIAKRQEVRQAVMQQLFSGESRLPGFSGPWRFLTVGDIADVKTGPFGTSLHERDYVSHGTPIITVEHLGSRGVEGAGAPMVSEADWRRLRAYSLAEGDIVFSRVGSIDRNARISSAEVGWLFSGRLLRVRFDLSKACPQFMSAQFHSHRFTEAVRAVAVGQTMPSLNTAILKSIGLDVPPLVEQQAIGSIAADFDRDLGSLEAKLAKARNLKQGMMQQLLTGKTRLPVEGAAT